MSVRRSLDDLVAAVRARSREGTRFDVVPDRMGTLLLLRNGAVLTRFAWNGDPRLALMERDEITIYAWGDREKDVRTILCEQFLDDLKEAT